MLSLDDFDSEYSSDSRLFELNVSNVKILKDFFKLGISIEFEKSENFTRNY